ncbi:MAG: bifunctional [glutamate--ammonia ligase]-adenylyl-L-tyrosine phosphorylase/[glutamate--ammonia-ligase] adenylyltransferase [Pontibacterium sp.]
MSNTIELPLIPELNQHLTTQQARLSEALSLAANLGEPWTPALQQQLARVLTVSNFVADQFARYPQWLAELVSSGDLAREYAPHEYQARLSAALESCDDETKLHQALRVFRNREQVRLIWRDLNRMATLQTTTRELSALADACIDLTLEWVYQAHIARFGIPYSTDDEGNKHQEKMVVIGMGKLGAGELNLSSDIDLIFCYPNNGFTEGAARSIDNQAFFIKVGKKLIQALDQRTADGFVFRVDMRLRPFGSASPLAASFDAMELYYQQQGREWERYAMIKAREVAGDKVAGADLLTRLKPFVFRRYLDFSAFESLREMKALINQEVRRLGREENIKLGAGGIRELEFIVQAFQLLRGGRDTRLQQRALCDVLPLLPSVVEISDESVSQLLAANVFLRNTEHVLQALDDRQTQTLPDAELACQRVAFGMGYTDWSAFYSDLHSHREIVHQHFETLIETSEDEQAPEDGYSPQWLDVWHGRLNTGQVQTFMAEQGFEDPVASYKTLTDLANSRTVQVLQNVAVERLEAVLPCLLTQVGQTNNSHETLERVLTLIQAVLRRSAYLVLLAENPMALEQLVKLCSFSDWFSSLLSRYPVLLDELIDPHTLYTPPNKQDIHDQLRQMMLRVPEDDTEQLMETLRYFKSATSLRVAASEVTGALPLMKVSDYLTWTADAIIEQATDIAWRDMTHKYGQPTSKNADKPEFIVVGYGKVGGIELSYGSDLDLVFIHNCDAALETDGDKAIGNGVFFTRLGQRIIHILNTFTASGQLYEVDMRLRPSGNSGLLVSSLNAFDRYQREEAWTWEHQALVRARVITGGEQLARAFADCRAKVLMLPRETETLKAEVAKMRQKMRDHLGTKSKDQDTLFHIKHDAGGMVDIEFITQYLVLRSAAEQPSLVEFSDNIRVLESATKAQLITASQQATLIDAYVAYRSAGHLLTLQGKSTQVSAASFIKQREAVSRLWQSLLPANEG